MSTHIDDKFIQLSARLGELLIQKNFSIVTAESCTGGWLSHVLTSLPKTSSWFERGFITYSDDSKIELLEVDSHLIEEKGAVSKEVAIAMAKGALNNSKAQVSIAITGLAGPDKDDESSPPVGTCWISWSIRNKQVETICKKFDGDRTNVNYQAIEFAISHLIEILKSLD